MRVRVRLAPQARAARIEGVVRLGDGTAVLKVSVTAPPAEGRANEALLRLLAKEWRVARRDLAIVGGLKSRSKLVHVAGDPVALMRRIADPPGGVPAA
jgi:uncharacterized protein